MTEHETLEKNQSTERVSKKRYRRRITTPGVWITLSEDFPIPKLEIVLAAERFILRALLETENGSDFTEHYWIEAT